MKLWIEYLTPKQLMFYKPIIDEAEKRGWRVLVTTRRYREVNFLTKLLKVNSIAIGKYGGGDLSSKLACSINRMKRLTALIREFKPDVAISTSPDAARVAFGLGIPHILVNDSPHSIAVAKLTVPLSSKLLTPWVIPVDAWVKYGISSSDVVQYKALDPAMWLKRLNIKLKPAIPKAKYKHIIVMRVEEVHASYMMIEKPTLLEEPIRRLALKVPEALIIVLPRYDWQMKYLKSRFKDLSNIKIPSKPLYGPSLLKIASIFIGSGGTMTCEAALMGVPAYSYYPKELMYVEKFLIDFGLLKRIKCDEIVEIAISSLSDIDELKAKHQELSSKLWSIMEDPLPVAMKVIESFYSKV